MKAIYIYLLVIIFGCKSSSFIKSEGSSPLNDNVYSFADSDVRNLTIAFLNNETITVRNSVSGLQATNYHRYNFITKYQIKKVDLFRYVIGNPVEKTDSLGGKKYILPFRKQDFYNRKDILPNIVGDTLFFNDDFKKLQLKDFSFTSSSKSFFQK